MQNSRYIVQTVQTDTPQQNVILVTGVHVVCLISIIQDVQGLTCLKMFSRTNTLLSTITLITETFPSTK